MSAPKTIPTPFTDAVNPVLREVCERCAHHLDTGHVLRTVDAARELSVDPDKFLRLAKRAGVVGKKERHGHLFWCSADVAAVRAYAEANGIELRPPG